jgi:hypothetical protein
MDRKSYARLILDDRQESSTFWPTLSRSIGRRNSLPVLLGMSVLLGMFYIWMDMLPVLGGFLIGLAVGCSAMIVGHIRSYMRKRALVDDFLDWKK